LEKTLLIIILYSQLQRNRITSFTDTALMASSSIKKLAFSLEDKH